MLIDASRFEKDPVFTEKGNPELAPVTPRMLSGNTGATGDGASYTLAESLANRYHPPSVSL